MSDAPCTVQPDAFVFRNLTVRGFWFADWFPHTLAKQRSALLGEIAGLIARGSCTRRFTPPTTSALSQRAGMSVRRRLRFSE